jgi:hypothetical protein
MAGIHTRSVLAVSRPFPLPSISSPPSCTAAIYSTLSFLACHAPRMTLLLYGIIPVPIWLAVSGIFAYDTYRTAADKVCCNIWQIFLNSCYVFVRAAPPIRLPMWAEYWPEPATFSCVVSGSSRTVLHSSYKARFREATDCLL